MQLGNEFKNYCISAWTLKREHIFSAIEAFLSENEIEEDEIVSLVDEYNARKETLAEDQIDYDEELDKIFCDLWDELYDIAPDGCYFGGSVGDGADIGFWECEDYP